MSTWSILSHSISLALSVQALLLAVLMFRFHEDYRRAYLRWWAWSWLAMTCYWFFRPVTLWLSLDLPSDHGLRIVTALATAVAGLWQPGLLLVGTSALTGVRHVETRTVRAVLAFLAAAAAVSVLLLLGDPDGGLIRNFTRFGFRSFVAGAVFIVCAVALWRSGEWHESVGRRLVVWSIGAYGVEQLFYFGASLGQMVTARPFTFPIYFGIADFLTQSLIGLGMVMSFLEEERRQVVRASVEIERLSMHDALTGLPGRTLFLDRLELALAQAGRAQAHVSVLCVNVDRLRAINESLGQSVGNELLRSVGDRLKAVVRGGDTVARLGGDQFGLVVLGLADLADARAFAERLRVDVRRPFALGAQHVSVTASVGMAVRPESGTEANVLLHQSEVAMQFAKEEGRDTVRLFRPEMEVGGLAVLEHERAVRAAIADRAFVQYWQPIERLGSGAIERLEALARWPRPDGSLRLPAEFIPLAESLGLSGALDLWALTAACAQAQVWRQEGRLPRHIAVNVSARTFHEPELLARLGGLLAEARLPAGCLELEITESVAMRSADVTHDILQGLRQLGVRLAIDDFGTGHSSLAYLRHFAVDTVKLDQSFVRDLPRARDASAITAAVIALSHSLGMEVVAEGVETETQRELLGELGCDLVQGFLVSRPLTAEACGQLLAGRGGRRPTPPGAHMAAAH